MTSATRAPTAGNWAWFLSKQTEKDSSTINTIGVLCNKGKEEMNEWGNAKHAHYSQYFHLERVHKASRAHFESFNKILAFKMSFALMSMICICCVDRIICLSCVHLWLPGGSKEGGGWMGSLGFWEANFYIWNGWEIGSYCTAKGIGCEWVILLHNRNWGNIVSQLHFNKKKYEKRHSSPQIYTNILLYILYIF